ncbi:MAG: hypothetical protein GX594_07745, partial [Pirellulaceae bacterium]|nr:hypothetical protein [Pirellulaceae bacterium]
ADVLAGTDWLDEQWFFNPRAEDRQLRCRAVARRMRGERFDLAVLTTNSLRTAWVAWRGGAKRRVGYVRYGRGPLLTDKLSPKRQGRKIAPEPMVDSYLRLAYAVGCEAESPRLELTATEADERSADGVFQRLGLGQRPIAALNSSGAYGGAKLWPVEYFAQLARRIIDELHYDVLVCCGPKEREIAREIVRQAESITAGSRKGGSPIFGIVSQLENVDESKRPATALEGELRRFPPRRSQPAGVFTDINHRTVNQPPDAPSPQKQTGASSKPPHVVSMADQPMDLGTAKACIRRCRVMASTDSGPRHVAAALGLPVVTMFGPMLPVWSENPAQRAANLVLDLDCIGCHKRVCPLGHHRCMRDLSVDTVFDAVCRLLDAR